MIRVYTLSDSALLFVFFSDLSLDLLDSIPSLFPRSGL